MRAVRRDGFGRQIEPGQAGGGAALPQEDVFFDVHRVKLFEPDLFDEELDPGEALILPVAVPVEDPEHGLAA
jgi:hypothetical protein